MWILILTIMASQTSSSTNKSSTIANIEFSTKESCMIGGNAWLHHNPSSYYMMSSICVEK